MDYLSFERALRIFPVFSTTDIKKRFPDFDGRRLVEWQQKRYIIKLRREYYCFADRRKEESFLFFASNKIYSPSYISLESALAYYGLIPEGVFLTSGISSGNTAKYQTPFGEFSYNHLKPSLFFGYRLIRINDSTIKMADPEKALLDFIYLKKIDTTEAFEGLRLNVTQLKEILDYIKLNDYQKLFKSRVLNKRIALLKNVINA